MKKIFFSDVHKDEISLRELLRIETGQFYCLGDSELNNEELKEYNIISVKGNCDTTDLEDYIILEDACDKILLVHGHKFNVKFTLNNIYHFAKSLNCNIVIFGHTHLPLEITEDVSFYNPGSLRDGQTYITYENKQITFKKLR